MTERKNESKNFFGSFFLSPPPLSKALKKIIIKLSSF